MTIIYSLLINLILCALLLYTFRANKSFFVVALLIVLLLIFIFPDILIPSILWEKLLKQ
mgnify:CR=1 FL=1